MSKLTLLISGLILCLALNGCGGGGGSDSSSSESNVSISSSAKTGVRVIHGAIDAPPVDTLSSTKSGVLDRVYFGLPSFYAELPAGEQIVSIVKSKHPETVLKNIPITVSEGERRTILLFGNEEKFGIQTATLLDKPQTVEAGSAKFRIIHALIGAGEIRTTLEPSSAEATAKFGTASNYEAIPAGSYAFRVGRLADGVLVLNSPKLFESGKVYTVLVTGEVGVAVFATLFTDS